MLIQLNGHLLLLINPGVMFGDPQLFQLDDDTVSNPNGAECLHEQMPSVHRLSRVSLPSLRLTIFVIFQRCFAFSLNIFGIYSNWSDNPNKKEALNVEIELGCKAALKEEFQWKQRESY